MFFLNQELRMHLDQVIAKQNDQRSVPPNGRDEELRDTFIDSIEDAYKEKRWAEVVKIGAVLSRPLWVTGQHELRVRLGRMLENAAAYIADRKIQALALVDDLGWTNFELGNVEEAKKNILSGIQLAHAYGYPYIAHKGHRHLSGIAVRQGDLEDAEFHLDEALKYAKDIQDDQKKNEVVAGISVSQALILMKRQLWEEARERLEGAQAMYHDMGDKEREVKLYSFIGDAYLGMGEYQLAKNWYREGLAKAFQESRKDGILTNNLGLARVAVEEKDFREARRTYLEAAQNADSLGRHDLADELKMKADSLT